LREPFRRPQPKLNTLVALWLPNVLSLSADARLENVLAG
jgi:hypothetical protein